MVSSEEAQERQLESDIGYILGKHINKAINEILDEYEYVEPDLMRRLSDQHFQELLIDLARARTMGIEELQTQYGIDISQLVTKRYVSKEDNKKESICKENEC